VLLNELPFSLYLEKEAIAEFYFLALLYKKELNFTLCEKVFTEITGIKEKNISKGKKLELFYFQHYCAIELAKIFEHKKKLFQPALDNCNFSEKCLNNISSIKLTMQTTKDIDNKEKIKKRSWKNWLAKEKLFLDKRKKRLQKRLP